MTAVVHHERVTVRRVLALTALLPGALAAVVAAESAASAAGCAATVNVTRPTLAVMLQPSQVTVDRGACVTFVNNAGTVVEVTVAPDFDERLAAGDSAVYSARHTGSHAMRADDGITHDDGTVTVRSPAPSPQPSSSSPHPTRPPSSRPAPGATTTTAAATQGSGPRVAPSPSHHPRRSTSPVPQPARSPQVPAPVPSTSPTPMPAVAVGPVEPPSGRASGLPGAVAALTIVGVGGAFVRVLLAQPVDSDPTVGSAL